MARACSCAATEFEVYTVERATVERLEGTGNLAMHERVVPTDGELAATEVHVVAQWSDGSSMPLTPRGER